MLPSQPLSLSTATATRVPENDVQRTMCHSSFSLLLGLLGIFRYQFVKTEDYSIWLIHFASSLSLFHVPLCSTFCSVHMKCASFFMVMRWCLPAKRAYRESKSSSVLAMKTRSVTCSPRPRRGCFSGPPTNDGESQRNKTRVLMGIFLAEGCAFPGSLPNPSIPSILGERPDRRRTMGRAK